MISVIDEPTFSNAEKAAIKEEWGKTIDERIEKYLEHAASLHSTSKSRLVRIIEDVAEILRREEH